MTTTELIREVQKRLPPKYRYKYKYRELKMILDHLLEATVESVTLGEDVQLRSFGRFSPEVHRYMDNLGDGNSKDVVRIVFRPSKKLKQAMKNTVGNGRMR